MSHFFGDLRAARRGALAPLLAIATVVVGCPADEDTKDPDVYEPTTMAPPNESATAASPIDDDADDADDDDGSSSGEASDVSGSSTGSVIDETARVSAFVAR